MRLERAWRHFLEANNHNAIIAAMSDHVAAHKEASGASAAVVVDIIDLVTFSDRTEEIIGITDRNACQAELVEDTLATYAVTIAVAGDTLLDIVIVDFGIEHCLDTGLVAQLGVVNLASGLDKFCHPYAYHVDGVLLLWSHGEYLQWVLYRCGASGSGKSFKGRENTKF